MRKVQTRVVNQRSVVDNVHQPPSGARSSCSAHEDRPLCEDLDQDFNSLEAQREACEAYIRSQAHGGLEDRSGATRRWQNLEEI